LSCGIPCLGSDIEEIREVLHYDELLFSLDHIAGLVEKIRRAYKDDEYYKRLLRLSAVRCGQLTGDWEEKAVGMVTG
jgi:glycosyltransferase involved in cell wall biosynthesis